MNPDIVQYNVVESVMNHGAGVKCCTICTCKTYSDCCNSGSAINKLDNLGFKCALYLVAQIERNHRRSRSTSRILRLRSDQRWGAIGHSKVQVISWFFNNAAIADRIVPRKPLFSCRSLRSMIITTSAERIRPLRKTHPSIAVFRSAVRV